MWDLHGPGIEPVSPALASGFLTTAPPGKSPHFFFIPGSGLKNLCLFGTCCSHGRGKRVREMATHTHTKEQWLLKLLCGHDGYHIYSHDVGPEQVTWPNPTSM